MAVIGDLLQSIGLVPVHLWQALSNPSAWLDWSNGEALMRFVYYGGSRELMFVALTIFAALTLVAAFVRPVLWGGVRTMEGFANFVGRAVAWVGLIMVIQQILIVLNQRIFAAPDMAFGFGTAIRFDISWWAEELKLWNAMIVALCCAWTFVQKGHVRVDLVYAPLSFRAKRVVDMLGAMIFMLPFSMLAWHFSWFFMWRHLITPKVSSSDKLEQMLMKARVIRWNVETIGFSPNGFNAYFLFKMLMVAFCAMVFLQAWAFFWRSLGELLEGQESEDKHLDHDWIEPDEVELSGPERHMHPEAYHLIEPTLQEPTVKGGA